jgi:hypothetical protein
VVADALVGARDDAKSNGLALGIVSAEEGRASERFVHVGDLPGQVEGVLDAGVASQAVEGGVAVDGVAEAEAADADMLVG